MPRIGNNVLGCVFYLFRDEENARAGEKFQGTGFLLGVRRGWPEPLEPQTTDERSLLVVDTTRKPFATRGAKEQELFGGYHVYAVTNSHLIRAGAVVARFNLPQGGTYTARLPADGWIHHPDGDDVAICRFDPPEESLAHNLVGLDQMLSSNLAQELDAGPGDECVFFGLYWPHSGGALRNYPAMRFGFISRVADATDKIQTAQPGVDVAYREGYLVEGRSQEGFSGSPVFVHFPPWQLSKDYPGGAARNALWEKLGLCWFLLGVNWSHFPDAAKVDVLDSEGRASGDKLHVQLNSGMMCVSPAWKLLDILNLPELVAQRARDCLPERRLREIVAGRPKGP